ncbi:GGDEF domain-containing protein [Niveibacterium sp. SC-1]|uniref:GGDEF domain-containing protein n=1 Tax=Niveibacterium sp. SC-1 TaxID=3135646 RepID=UPI00311E89CF
MQSTRSIRWIVASLMLISVVALAWQQLGMNVSVRIDAATHWSLTASNDKASGGASEATLSREGQKLVLHCKLAAGATPAHCGLDAEIGKASRGYDFSRFDRIVARLGAQGATPPQLTLRLNSTRRDGVAGARPSELPLPADGEIEAPLGALQVPQAWLDAQKLDATRRAIEVSNVTLVQLLLNGEPGDYTLTLDSLELRGKAFTLGEVALAVVGLWMLAGLAYLVFDLRVLRRQLLALQERDARLKELNNALQIETATNDKAPRRDPLTGVRNRVGMRDDLLREFERARSEKTPLSVVCCDIDHLSTINESHGQPLGDEVLVAFAQSIARRVRSSDLVVRWADDEFFLFCPDTSYESGLALAEKLRSIVMSHDWPKHLGVTASFGVATLSEEPIADCLARADAALFNAKQNGRNRVEGLVRNR